MAFFVFLPQVSIGQMRIYLSSRDTGVAQKFLHVTQGGSFLQQVGGEAVPERVGRYFLVDTRPFAVGLHNVPNPLAGQALTPVVHKQRRFFLV